MRTINFFGAERACYLTASQVRVFEPLWAAALRQKGVLLALIGLACPGLAAGEGTLQFARGNYSFGEGCGAAGLTVNCTGASNQVSVHYETADLTATNGIAYVGTAGTLTFSPGVTNLPLMIGLINDGLVTGSRAFRVSLSQPMGAALGALSNAVVNVVDNDSGIAFTLATWTASEVDSEVSVYVTRGEDGPAPVSVEVATSDITAVAGVDYTATTNTLTFGPNDSFKFACIPILNNSLKDGSRSFRLTLSNPQGTRLGSRSIMVISIADDDAGFRLESSTNSVSEDAGACFVKVLRSPDLANSPASVDYATSDATAFNELDYQAVNGTLHFDVGETAKLVPIPILNDTEREPVQTFRFTLSNPSPGAGVATPATTTISIIDKDPGVAFASAATTNQWGESELLLPVIRGSDQLLGPFTVSYATSDGSAKAGTDYEAASGTLAFEANETIKAVSIRLLTPRPASQKYFRVTLSGPTGGLALGLPSAMTAYIGGTSLILSPPDNPGLAVRSVAGAGMLTWQGKGQLQKADTPNGPWQPLVRAASPWAFQPGARSGFYRVVLPRAVSLYVPSAYDGHTPMPLIVALHGYTATGAGMEAYTKLLPLAESRGFFYCYPDGTADITGNQFWMAFNDMNKIFGPTFPPVDDVAFLAGIIEDAARHVAVDRKRIYLVGHSNGAYMSHWMAFNHAELVAGIAALAGTVPAVPINPRPSEPVNVLHIHGTADATVSYTDFLMTTPTGPLFAGAMHTVQQWADSNGASMPVTDPYPTLDLDSSLAGLDTTVTRFTTSPPGGAVELWTIGGGGHSPSFSATYASSVVDWLLAHPKP